MTRLLIAAAAFIAGWWAGRDHEWRIWQREQQDAEDEMAGVQVDVYPVPMTTTEVVSMLTRDWDAELRVEWEFNR